MTTFHPTLVLALILAVTAPVLVQGQSGGRLSPPQPSIAGPSPAAQQVHKVVGEWIDPTWVDASVSGARGKSLRVAPTWSGLFIESLAIPMGQLSEGGKNAVPLPLLVRSFVAKEIIMRDGTRVRLGDVLRWAAGHPRRHALTSPVISERYANLTPLECDIVRDLVHAAAVPRLTGKAIQWPDASVCPGSHRADDGIYEGPILTAPPTWRPGKGDRFCYQACCAISVEAGLKSPTGLDLRRALRAVNHTDKSYALLEARSTALRFESAYRDDNRIISDYLLGPTKNEATFLVWSAEYEIATPAGFKDIEFEMTALQQYVADHGGYHVRYYSTDDQFLVMAGEDEVIPVVDRQGLIVCLILSTVYAVDLTAWPEVYAGKHADDHVARTRTVLENQSLIRVYAEDDYGR